MLTDRILRHEPGLPEVVDPETGDLKTDAIELLNRQIADGEDQLTDLMLSAFLRPSQANRFQQQAVSVYERCSALQDFRNRLEKLFKRALNNKPDCQANLPNDQHDP